MPTAFKWETPNYFGVDARGIALSQYFCPTDKLGTGSFYFGTFHDHSGKPLEGQRKYGVGSLLTFIIGCLSARAVFVAI